MSNDSRRLLERYCRDGDQASFSVFYRAQADRLWRYLRLRGCAPEPAYDLLAEAFLRFIRVICRDPRQPVALLYRIAVNLQIDAWRRQQASLEQPAAATDPEPAATAVTDDREYVRKLLRVLPPDEQNLLLLRYWIGLTHKEIAGMLEKPEGTIRRQCAGALETLRRRWREELHG